MGLGVLEGERWLVSSRVLIANDRNKDKSALQNVPGTVLLNDAAAHVDEAVHNLKHGTGRNSHIVLSPQPSEDPNDPLNWKPWRKELIIMILSLGAMLNAGTNVR